MPIVKSGAAANEEGIFVSCVTVVVAASLSPFTAGFQCPVCMEKMVIRKSRPSHWPSGIRICVACVLFFARTTDSGPACPPGTCPLGLRGLGSCIPCRFQRGRDLANAGNFFTSVQLTP